MNAKEGEEPTGAGAAVPAFAAPTAESPLPVCSVPAQKEVRWGPGGSNETAHVDEAAAHEAAAGGDAPSAGSDVPAAGVDAPGSAEEKDPSPPPLPRPRRLSVMQSLSKMVFTAAQSEPDNS